MCDFALGTHEQNTLGTRRRTLLPREILVVVAFVTLQDPEDRQDAEDGVHLAEGDGVDVEMLDPTDFVGTSSQVREIAAAISHPLGVPAQTPKGFLDTGRAGRKPAPRLQDSHNIHRDTPLNWNVHTQHRDLIRNGYRIEDATIISPSCQGYCIKKSPINFGDFIKC